MAVANCMPTNTRQPVRLIRSEFDELMRLCLDAKIFDKPIEYHTYVDETFMKNARPVGIDLGAP